MSGRQERVQRHTVHQILDAISPTLDVPVPRREEQLVAAVLTHFDFLLPEQVIEVLKISLPSSSWSWSFWRGLQGFLLRLGTLKRTTCARLAGTHGSVLNVHTEVLGTYTQRRLELTHGGFPRAKWRHTP